MSREHTDIKAADVYSKHDSSENAEHESSSLRLASDVYQGFPKTPPEKVPMELAWKQVTMMCKDGKMDEQRLKDLLQSAINRNTMVSFLQKIDETFAEEGSDYRLGMTVGQTKRSPYYQGRPFPEGVDYSTPYTFQLKSLSTGKTVDTLDLSKRMLAMY